MDEYTNPNVLSDSEIREADLDIETMLDACIGATNDNQPKCAITMVNQRYYIDKPDLEPIEDSAYPCQNPIIGIQSRGDYVAVTLEFTSTKDVDFRSLWEQLQTYGHDMDTISDNDKTVPASLLVITPVAFKGKYYILFSNPVFWCIQPDKPDGELRCLSLLYELDDMDFYENADAIEEFNEMDRNVTKEIEADLAWRAEREQRRLEKEEWERRRQERYEEMRRNGEIKD